MGRGAIRLVGDITTVSDAGLDNKNPVKLLQSELARIARKYRLNPNHFGYDVRGEHVGPYGNARTTLFLEGRAALLIVMKEAVEPFVRELSRSHSHDSISQEFRAGTVAFTVSYDHSQRFGSGGHAAYDIPYSLTKNPLAKTLQRKSDQLQAAPEDAPRLVIVCDGDCAIMSRPSHAKTPGTYTAREIARDFLRQSNTIDLVLLVSIEGPSSGAFRMKYDLEAAQPGARSDRLSEGALEAITGALRKAEDQIPAPVLAPNNTVLRCAEPEVWPGMIGGCQMGGSKVRISARAVLSLLAGEISQEKFMAAHGWDKVGKTRNPFLRALMQGRLIESMEVTPEDQRDDDWLEFRFGSPDPAAGPFVRRQKDNP